MDKDVITYTENEDFIFLLATKELLRISERMKTFFGEEICSAIQNLDDFEKFARLPSSLGAREECYPKLVDLKANYEVSSRNHDFLIEEIGWYNSNTGTIHMLIFPRSQESPFSITHKSLIDTMDKINNPAVLFDTSLTKVLATNLSLIDILCEPLSKLGLGFNVEDFFMEKAVFQELFDWINSRSNAHTAKLQLRLKSPSGCWFEGSFTKIKVEGDLRVMVILKDIDDLIQVQLNQFRKNLILSRLTETQILFLSKTTGFNPYQLFLDAILDISMARYGFVGEVGNDENGARLMKIHAVTDFGKESLEANILINKLKEDNFFFRHFDNLFGACIKTGKVICENFPQTNPHSSNKVIVGHPRIENFLGIPILSGKEVVGLIGLGNKPGGFTQNDVWDLSPFATTYSVILNALDNEERNQILQKDTSEKNLILSTVGDHSPDTIVVLDGGFQFKFLSPGFSKHFGRKLSREDAEQKIKTIIKKTIAPKYWQSESYYRSRLRLKQGGSEGRWLETSINVFEGEEGEDRKIIAFIRDVTIQVRSEQSLRASLKKEKEFKAFLTDFMNIVAHEFKTPLATILSSLEISSHYLQGIVEDNPNLGKVSHHLSKIKREVEQLHRIVVNSLDYERFAKENSSLKKEHILLNEFVRQTLVEYGFFEKVLVETEISEEFVVCWDRFFMQTTLVNLVGNALKYSKGKPQPVISLFQDGAGFGLRIRDFGIGISDADLPYIFTPYYRGSNTNSIEGTGMGLIAVKNFVRLHGGDVFVNSKEEVGTEVSILFK